MFDFHARQYDPQLGRFNSVDALANKFASMSPYTGMGNNPLLFIDKDGKEIVLYRNEKNDNSKLATINKNGITYHNTSEEAKKEVDLFLKSKHYLDMPALDKAIENDKILSIIISPFFRATDIEYVPYESNLHYKNYLVAWKEKNSEVGHIYWNPSMSIQDPEGNYHSPALALGYEIKHAYLAMVNINAFIKGVLSEKEEARVIQEMNDVIKQLIKKDPVNFDGGGNNPETMRKSEGYMEFKHVDDPTQY